MASTPDTKTKQSTKLAATKSTNGQTGPKTELGKAISSRNSTKTGLHTSGWIDSIEEQEYQDLFQQLSSEYNAKSTTLLIQIERMASTMIKMRRLQKIESALFQKARALAEIRAKERESIPAIASQEPEQAILAAQLSAMPDMDRLATLQRYQTSLDRQLSKVIGEIRVLTINSLDTLPKSTIDLHHELNKTTVQKNSDGSSSRTTTIDE